MSITLKCTNPEKANENIIRGSLMTNLKLQKLLYYAYIWKLVLNNEMI